MDNMEEYIKRIAKKTHDEFKKMCDFQKEMDKLPPSIKTNIISMHGCSTQDELVQKMFDAQKCILCEDIKNLKELDGEYYCDPPCVEDNTITMHDD